MSDKDLAKLLLISDMALFNSSHEELVELEKDQGRDFDTTCAETMNIFNVTLKKYKKQRLEND